MRGGAPILSVCRADFIPGRYIRFPRSTGSYRSPYIRFIKKTCYGFFSKIPERVIINRLNGAETLMALGAADRIIAVNMQNTDWGKPYDDRYMEQGKALEKITYRNLTKEEAVLLNPDCIIDGTPLLPTKGWERLISGMPDRLPLTSRRLQIW